MKNENRKSLEVCQVRHTSGLLFLSVFTSAPKDLADYSE